MLTVYGPKSLGRSPVKLEVLAQVKYEIFYTRYLATDNIYYRYTTVLSLPSIPVRKLYIPMYTKHVGTSESKDVLNTDVLYIEMDSWKLVEEIAKPVFNGALAFKRTAFSNVTGINKHAIIPPCRTGKAEVVKIPQRQYNKQPFCADSAPIISYGDLPERYKNRKIHPSLQMQHSQNGRSSVLAPVIYITRPPCLERKSLVCQEAAGLIRLADYGESEIS